MITKVAIIGAGTPSEGILQILDDKFGKGNYDIITIEEAKAMCANPYQPTIIDERCLQPSSIPIIEDYLYDLDLNKCEPPHVHRSAPLPKRVFDRNLRPKGTHTNRKFYR